MTPTARRAGRSAGATFVTRVPVLSGYRTSATLPVHDSLAAMARGHGRRPLRRRRFLPPGRRPRCTFSYVGSHLTVVGGRHHAARDWGRTRHGRLRRLHRGRRRGGGGGAGHRPCPARGGRGGGRGGG